MEGYEAHQFYDLVLREGDIKNVAEICAQDAELCKRETWVVYTKKFLYPGLPLEFNVGSAPAFTKLLRRWIQRHFHKTRKVNDMVRILLQGNFPVALGGIEDYYFPKLYVDTRLNPWYCFTRTIFEMNMHWFAGRTQHTQLFIKLLRYYKLISPAAEDQSSSSIVVIYYDIWKDIPTDELLEKMWLERLFKCWRFSYNLELVHDFLERLGGMPKKLDWDALKLEPGLDDLVQQAATVTDFVDNQCNEKVETREDTFTSMSIGGQPLIHCIPKGAPSTSGTGVQDNLIQECIEKDFTCTFHRKGGNSSVILAIPKRKNLETPEKFALKISNVPAPFKQNIDIRNEAAMLLALSHENIVKVQSFWFETMQSIGFDKISSWSLDTHFQNYLVLKMEMCDTDLDLWMKEPGKLPQRRRNSFSVLEQCLKALNYLHSNPIQQGKCIIHRDIKPRNILVNSRGKDVHVKLADFGVSKWTEAYNTDSRTHHSANIGTAIYRPEEQTTGKHYGRKVDVYSLGLVMIQVVQSCSGNAEDAHSILEQARKQDITEYVADCTQTFQDILKKMISQKYEERPYCKDILEVWSHCDWTHGNLPKK